MDAQTAAAPDKRREKTPWNLMLLLIAMTAISPVAINILVPALPAMAPLLNTDAGTAQLALSLYLLSLACSQLLLGPLSDRFGRRPVVLAGLALFVVAGAAAIFASSIGALITARVLQALGGSAGIVIGRAIVRDLYDRDRAAAMLGAVTTAMVVAPMVAPLIGGILDTTLGWQSIFVFLSVFGTAILLWAFLVLPETRPERISHEPSQLWKEWGALLKSARFHGYVLAGGLGSAPFFAFVGGAPHVMVSQMGHSSAEYGLWFMTTSIGYMGGNFAASRLSQRWGINRMIVGGSLISVAGAVVGVSLVQFWPHWGPITIFLPQVVIAFGNGALLPNSIAGAISVRPQAAGAASGIAGFGQMATGAVAAQFITVVIADAATAMPLVVTQLAFAASVLAVSALLGRR